MSDNDRKIKNLIDSLSITENLHELLTKGFGKRVGEVAIRNIQNFTAKGLSPIRGQRAYPKYKAVQKSLGVKGKSKKALKKISSIQKKGYPYSVQDKFPDKKLSPVNLRLSGYMMSDLDSTVEQTPDGLKVTVDYQDIRNQLKEQGHREGVNGQPKRPTLPIDKEKFAVTIDKDIQELVTKELAKRLEKKLKG